MRIGLVRAELQRAPVCAFGVGKLPSGALDETQVVIRCRVVWVEADGGFVLAHRVVHPSTAPIQDAEVDVWGGGAGRKRNYLAQKRDRAGVVSGVLCGERPRKERGSVALS
jgi:hypothetical protein